jgi:hypothetical protein
MDIEKIKNYNQKVLALVLTLLLAFAAIGLLSLIFYLFVEVFDYSSRSSAYQPEGIQAEENQTQSEQQSDPYKLHACYEFPDLVDTLNQLFIIPVTHKTEYEIQDNLVKRGGSWGIKSADTYSSYTDYYSQPTYINLLIYNAKSGNLDKMFSQQILTGQYNKYHYKDDIIVVFEAAGKDSNKDGRITLNDETSLYFYSIKNKTLKQAGLEGLSVLQYAFIATTKNAFIRFGLNPDKRYDNNNEDLMLNGILCQFSYDTGNLVKINNIKLDKELETLAGGDNKKK